MNEPRKPIFWFLWSSPDPNAPVDGAYRQVRPVRITPRGPIRLLALIVGTALTVMFVATATISAFAAPVLGAVLLSAAIGGGACFLILRGWVVGTFVSDEAVRVETTFGRTETPWSAIARVEIDATDGPFLGLPLRVRGERAHLVLSDGLKVPTHVYTTSPDLWLRPEAFDMARLRLERWADQA